MPSADNNPTERSVGRRRLMLRRSGNPGFGGVSTASHGGYTPGEHDEVDDAIEPETTAERADALTQAARASAAPPVVEPDDGAFPDDIEPNRRRLGANRNMADPRARLDEVALAGSASYAKEYRLSLLHRLLMRKVPLDQIAAQLNVSISTIEKDRVALKQRLREHAAQLDINEIIGRNLEIYDEIRGMSLRVASSGETRDANGQQQSVPTAMKLAAMRTALAATNDQNRMLSTAGVFEALRFKRAEQANGMTDMERLMSGGEDLIRMVCEEIDGDGPSDDKPEPEAKHSRRVVRRKGSGFGPLTYEDNGGESSDTEFVEL